MVDPVEKVVERLNALSDEFFWRPLADEAASLITEQARQLAEKETENFALAADQCHAGYAGEYGHHRCNEIDTANARAIAAEARATKAEEALAGEREACALIAENYRATTQFPAITVAVAMRIRARSGAKDNVQSLSNGGAD